MTFPVPAPNAGPVTDPSLMPLIESGPTVTPPQAAFVKVVLNRPIRRAADIPRPVPPPRTRAKSVKRYRAPEPPQAAPARPPSPTESSKAAFRQVLAELEASTSPASDPRPDGPTAKLLGGATAPARAKASRTRFGRLRDRVADAVPAPLRRAWQAVIDSLRSCVAWPQA